MAPRFSAIIPTRGDSPHLRSALASALAAHDSLEVLLVHDRRSGEPPLPADLRRSAGVRHLELDAGGPAAARNAGLREALGRFVGFLDDDDLWLSDHLRRAERMLEADPDAVLVAGDAWLLHDPSPDGSAPLPPEPASLPRFAGDAPPGPIGRRELLLANRVLTPTVVLYRQRLGSDGSFREDLPVMEDYELWLRLAERGRLLFDPQPSVVVRRRPESASADRAGMARHSLRILEELQRKGGICPPLTRWQRNRRLGGLWHDLAHACLIEDDGPGAVDAARRAVACLPLFPGNYIYLLLGAFPRLRRRWLARRRPDRLEAEPGAKAGDR